MNDAGRAYATTRLLQCSDLTALRRVWESLGNEYQRDPKIQKLKDRLKEALK